MAYVAVVPTVYNYAMAGCMAGMNAGRSVVSATQADYDPTAAIASAIAQEVDTLNGADATLAGGGATVVPASAANANAGETKPGLIGLLCFGALYGRTPSSVTVGDYATIANAVLAQYKAVNAVRSAL